MTDQLVDSTGELLQQLREVATELIDQHLATIPTRRNRTSRVLSTLLTCLETLDPKRRETLPIRLQQQDVQAVCKKLLRRSPLSLHARMRVGALGWLLHKLEEAGLLTIPLLRLPLQRPRGLAIQITEQVFRDEGLLGQALTPGFLRLLERRTSGQEVADLDLIVIAALIWEGPVLLPYASRLLQTLCLGDYDSKPGFLRIRPGSRSVRGSANGEAALRVFLRPLARILLNSYLLKQAESGVLDLGDLETRLFPSLASASAQEHGLNKALARCVAALVGQNKPTVSAQRLIEAARLHALKTFPPLIVSVLSHDLLYSPTPDAELLQLLTPGVRPTPASTLASYEPELNVREARSLEEVEEEGVQPAVAGSLEASYLEACEELRAVERMLEQPETRYPRSRVLNVAHNVLARLEADLSRVSEPPPLVVNLRLILRWLTWQLKNRTGTERLRVRNSRGSVRIRIQSLVPLFEAFLGDTEVLDLDEEGWIELTLDAMALQRVARSKKLMRARLKAFYAYLRAYESRPGRSVPSVDWRRRELAVPSELSSYSLLLPWELDTVRQSLAKLQSQKLAAVLDVLTVLAGYAGLRLREACGLRLGDVYLGLESLIRIGRAKTRSGRRVLPLHLLFPASELEQFRQFFAARMHEAAGDLQAPLLATVRYPGGLDPKELARRVSRAIKQEIGKPLTFHSLRHFFASFFPLRWFVAFYGRDAARSLGSLLETPLFSEEVLARFRYLFVPQTWEGQLVTTRPFEILAILMGHSGPEITVNVYVQTLDWLQRLYVEREVVQGPELRFTIEQAAGALNRSLVTIYSWFPGSKKGRGVLYNQILERQLALLDEAAS